ncbi:MAG: cytochrome c oxidase subunit 3 family protein [Bdellovibrionota bacterium]
MSITDHEKGIEPSHHFSSVEQEHEAAIQGIWLFLATEILMFGGLFVAYAMFRGMYPIVFHDASKFLDVQMGMVNTLVLIASSYCMAQAVHYTQKGETHHAFSLILLTILCALFFLGVKYFEYAHKFHEGLLPGINFGHAGVSREMGIFFGLYFVMTGLHAIHILVGIGLMIWLLVRFKRNEFSPHYFVPVDGVGLYWHIVDIIWIFLFPLLYLIG